MRPILIRVFLSAAALAALASPSRVRAEWPHDYRSPVQVAPVFGSQVVDAALPDGSGGAFVLFEDSRAGDKDVYAQHLRGDGTPDPAWPASGAPVCTATGDQTAIRAIPDAAGGFYAAWLDARGAVPQNYATRVQASGGIAPGFPVNGILLDSVRPNAQHAPQVAGDNAGGLVVVWEYDATPTNHDIYGAHVHASGLLTWSLPLYTGGSNDVSPSLDLESGSCAMTWGEGASQVSFMRFGPFSGAITGTVQVVSNQADPAVASRIAVDGWGGDYVAWANKVTGTWTIHASRFLSGVSVKDYGALSGSLPTVPVLGDMVYAGVFTTWFAWGVPSLGDVFLQSLTRDAAGPSQTAGASADLTSPLLLASDGAGGVLHAWGSTAGVTERILSATRRTISFGFPGLWGLGGFEGLPVMQLVHEALPGAMVSDGDGGAILFGYDYNLAPSQARAIRADRWGALDGAPHILSVKDVANDQGGQVRVAWKASYLDDSGNPVVDEYRLWRQVPVAAAQALLAHGARALLAGSDDAGQTGALRIEESLAGVFAWELVTSQVANAFPAYSLTVPTVADSGTGGPANTVYMVEARAGRLSLGWSSPPDSGHSVDNLPPATPSPFTATLVGGSATQLTWGANLESDLAGYELHQGTSAGFVPGPSNLVAFTASTSVLDPEVGLYYKLAALDVHGNRSGYALVTPEGTLDVPGGDAPRELALALASGNPSTRGATLRLALPRAGEAGLAVYDVNGRLVLQLLNGLEPAGERTLEWDGRDAAGNAAASGLYFVRLQAAGQERVRRVVLSH